MWCVSLVYSQAAFTAIARIGHSAIPKWSKNQIDIFFLRFFVWVYLCFSASGCCCHCRLFGFHLAWCAPSLSNKKWVRWLEFSGLWHLTQTLLDSMKIRSAAAREWKKTHTENDRINLWLFNIWRTQYRPLKMWPQRCSSPSNWLCKFQ